MFIGTPARLKTMSPPTSINVAGTLLPSSATLNLLGVTFDSHLSFKGHSASIIKSCNHLIWSIRHIHPLLSIDTTSALARSLVLSCMDYCNSLLYGTSTSLIHSLQHVQNKLAKLVLLNSTFNSTDCLKKLHWLPIHNRIIFKIALMTYRTLETNTIHPISNTSFSAVHLVFAHLPPFNNTNQFTNHPSSTEASRMPLLLSGMQYLPK